MNADDWRYLGATGTVLGCNLFSYCENNPIGYSDPTGTFVLSVGFEGQAAFVVGIYLGIALNIDQSNRVMITYSIGFAIITNVSAYIQGYAALYIGKNNVSQLTGWGISVGASFSCGVNLSGGASFDVGFDGSANGTLNVGMGIGASIAPVPYFQTRIGYTGKIKLFDAMKWKTNSAKTYRVLGMKIIVQKCDNYLKVYIMSLGKTIYVYSNRRVRIV